MVGTKLMNNFVIILIPYFGRQNIVQIIIIGRRHVRSIQHVSILIHSVTRVPFCITIHIGYHRDHIFAGWNTGSSTNTHCSVRAYTTRSIIWYQWYHNTRVSTNRTIELTYFQMLCTERLK
ncbi:hypothetical protein D3C74_388040 [compost metagenome]